MSNHAYICPRCGCPDLIGAKVTLVVDPKDLKVSCPNCKWSGTHAERVAVVSSENVYNTEAVFNMLLFVTLKHAAGPLAQAFEHIGLLEAGDQEGRDAVMRAAIEGLIEKSFVAAASHAASKLSAKSAVKEVELYDHGPPTKRHPFAPPHEPIVGGPNDGDTKTSGTIEHPGETND